jgi:hypothetical protein
MNEHEISSPTDLDTALNANALRKHANLWKVAEGRSFRWSEVLAGSIAALLCVVAITRISEDLTAARIELALAFAIVAAAAWGRLQRQMNALAEIVKRLEEER